MRRSIIIDTDPGQDDGVAILLALASPEELEVLGITTVAGNVPLSLTQVNARKIVELSGRRDVPVFAGADRPLVRPLVTAEYVHGRTGLDGCDLPEPTLALGEKHAADFIVETVMGRPQGSVTLCVLGPATNIALALAREPRIAGRLREIVWMAGAMSEGGNVTPAAEFNVYVDPEAAAKVVAAGVPLVMMPLDVTHLALTTAARLERLRALGTPVAMAVHALLSFAKRFDEGKYGTDGGPLHDPTTVAYLLQPELFQGRHVNVAIETAGALTAGMTVIDWWGVTDRPRNATVMRGIDADGYYDLIIERLGRLPLA
ncbi:nucleoside hydrolase [Chelatococcus sp. SYSU_G07232]|uniref:Nucleoside hydrolase n=1 Tax=Chelatococcus albus TaxID=3047466 RepID=A0ABT7AEH5_9HYPH|nr:nucleoside hydrolase [Chelatococcus sp. SYSU_G07232]MDJ1157769.1 nucleoside hydrolase [Chelatococcus sp. SYSU_G07232]